MSCQHNGEAYAFLQQVSHGALLGLIGGIEFAQEVKKVD